METRAAHAMIRFGLGRRAAEPPPADPEAWLAAQLEGPDPALARPAPSGGDAMRAIRESQRRKSEPKRGEPLRDILNQGNDLVIDSLLTTATPFRERLVWFWANHFTVSTKKRLASPLVNAYVREAIRPHVTGRLEDMVLAVMRHAAMLLYLDNAYSIGPNSPTGRSRQRGLNENLARECLELHTVTPAAGYTQADVTALANILTGWSIGPDGDAHGFNFRPTSHEPGGKTVLGQVYPEGEAGGIAALRRFATHPATTRNLASKLVRHFIADTPPEPAIARIDGVLRTTGGDLKAAARALIGLPEAWRPMAKLRSPMDYSVAVLRAIDLPADRRPDVLAIMDGLGQPLHGAPLPNGWSDQAADWAAPEAMMRRLDWAYAVAARGAALDPVVVAQNSLGPLLPQATREEIARAGSHREALTLLFASPEFQRR